MTETANTLDVSLGTAAEHATHRVPVAAATDTVDETWNSMRGRHFDSAAVVAVLDGERLLGLVSIEDLLKAAPGTAIEQIMDGQPPVVAPFVVQERAAWTAVQRPEPTLAVVDSGRFAGLVPPAALAQVLLQEHDEDMVRLGGFLRSTSSARITTVEPVHLRLAHRLPWLLVGLLGALLAAGVVDRFETLLSHEVLIAFFVPGIVYMADAIGTQTEAVVIRGLSLGVSVHRIARQEVTTGILLGILLGAMSLLAVWWLWGVWSVALAVAVALLAAASISTIIALALPWLISRLGKDPAFGSGPLATVLQDLLTVTIYLAVASAIVL